MDAVTFWRRVAKDHPTTCWPWVGSQTSAGYGNLRWQGRHDYAHRVSYALTVGPIPPGKVIDHLCRNRLCCNPAHLEAVTPGENTRRGLAPYGPLRGRCKHGHDITDPANVYTEPSGHHRCRPCAAASDRSRRSA